MAPLSLRVKMRRAVLELQAAWKHNQLTQPRRGVRNQKVLLVLPVGTLVYHLLSLVLVDLPVLSSSARIDYAPPFLAATALKIICAALSLLSVVDIRLAHAATPRARGPMSTTAEAGGWAAKLRRMSEAPQGLTGWPRDMRRWLVLCNGIVCGLVVAREWWWRSGGLERWWWEVVPSVVVYAVVLVGRRELRPVDVGVLEEMRYEYKGA